jgi:hypothetical protein
MNRYGAREAISKHGFTREKSIGWIISLHVEYENLVIFDN